MAGNLRFDWDRAALLQRVRAASERALTSLQPQAQTIWVSVVPVRTGRLRDSWFSQITTDQRAVVLSFGARAPYTIFVELGTIHMAPRAPIRRTAEQLAPAVVPRLLEELAA